MFKKGVVLLLASVCSEKNLLGGRSVVLQHKIFKNARAKNRIFPQISRARKLRTTNFILYLCLLIIFYYYYYYFPLLFLFRKLWIIKSAWQFLSSTYGLNARMDYGNTSHNCLTIRSSAWYQHLYWLFKTQ